MCSKCGSLLSVTKLCKKVRKTDGFSIVEKFDIFNFLDCVSSDRVRYSYSHTYFLNRKPKRKRSVE